VVIGGDVDYSNLVSDSSQRPIGVIDLDLTSINDPSNNGYVPERHASVGSETQDRARFRIRASSKEASRSGPPTPSVAEQANS
jgi:hypothetical protein